MTRTQQEQFSEFADWLGSTVRGNVTRDAVWAWLDTGILWEEGCVLVWEEGCVLVEVPRTLSIDGKVHIYVVPRELSRAALAFPPNAEEERDA